MLYIAMNLLREDQLDGRFEDVHILLTTHDEIALEAPTDVAQDARAWLEGWMRDAARMFLREELTSEDCVEGSAGPSWGGN
jgi:hypothetical protein